MNTNKILSFVGVCTALTASAYTDGEVIAHFPFDSDCLSIVNTSCNPASVETFGTVAAGSASVKAQGVYSPATRSLRSNAGCLSVNTGRVAIDITNFNLDSDHARYFTIEFFIKGNQSEITEWARLFDIGNASSMSGTCGVDSPFIVELAREGDHLYNKIQNNNSNTSFITPATGKAFDGEWHHIAYVFKKYTATQDCIDIYFDGERQGSGDRSGWSGDGKYFTWPKPTSGQKQYLFFGTNSGTVKILIDELRITAGSLTTSQFLRQTDDVTPPVDGETLMYQPMDNSIASIVHSEWAPSNLSGSLSYDASVWKPRVVTKDGTVIVRSENLACVKSTTDSNAKVDCPYWALQEGQLDSATIEFFIRGMGTEPDWGTTMTIEGGGNGFPLLVQIPTGKFFMRMDACTLVDGKTGNANGYAPHSFYVPVDKGTPTDGKWHHMAFTVAPLASGESEIKFYFDYAQIASFWSSNYAWRGLRANDCLRIAKNCGANIDEFRITKGVLSVDKFLKARGVGFALIYR